MRRRNFIQGLAGSLFLPTALRAQSTPLVGILHSSAPSRFTDEAFEAGLKETGYVSGRNVKIETRWARGDYEKLTGFANDLIGLHPDVLVTFGTAAARIGKPAAMNSQPAVSMVFALGSDPVAEGLVASLSRPGGNITGITSIAGSLAPKRMEFSREFLGNGTTLALLVHPDNPLSEAERRDTEIAAQAMGHKLEVLRARNDSEIERAFASLEGRHIGVLIIAVDAYFYVRMRLMAQLAQRYRIPAIGPLREFASEGGLMSYGTSIGEVNRLCGAYVGKVISGAKPADLPVLQPTKFELVLNLKSAKAYGIQFSPKLLALADEAIE